jgi:hypothetical protein
VLAGRTALSDVLAPTAETRRELSTAADDCVSSRAGVSCVRAETPASVERSSQQGSSRVVSATAQIRGMKIVFGELLSGPGRTVG